MIDINIDIVNNDQYLKTKWQAKHYCKDILKGYIDVEIDNGYF